MTTGETSPDSGFDELLSRYEKWRRIASDAGQTVPDEPAWDGRRLYLRYGYPHPDWTGYIIEPTASGGYQISTVTTERRNEPAEYPEAYFSRLEDAGKYLIWRNGESVRMRVGLRPLTPIWREEGLDPRVNQVSLDTYVSKFELKSDPAKYFILYQAGGIQPENRLLPLTYDELDTVLQKGMPTSLTSG